MLEGPTESKLKQMITSALSEFIKLLNDTNKKVSETASKLLEKIGELYPECFLGNANFLNYLEIILTALVI